MTEHKTEDKTKESSQLVKSDSTPSVHKQGGLFSYFRSSWAEFKKVVWPSRQEAVKMTMFVVIFVAVLALFVYGVDSAISWLFFDVILKRG